MKKKSFVQAVALGAGCLLYASSAAYRCEATGTGLGGSLAQTTLLGQVSSPNGKWFASTNPKHQNDDYIELKPGETRQIPLAAGQLQRLWATGKAPEKLELSLSNGSTVPLLRGGKALLGDYTEKAYNFYPDVVTPKTARLLTKTARLVVTNRDTQPNLFFYQASVGSESAGGPGPVAIGAEVSLGPLSANIDAGKTSAPISVDLKGLAGYVSEIRATIQPATLETLSHVYLHVDRLKITSRRNGIVSSQNEGQSQAVNASLASLADLFYNVRPVQNAMTSFDGKTLVLKWPMPFDGSRDDLTIGLENRGKASVEYTLSARVQPLAAPLPVLFCALSGSARTVRGSQIVLLNAKGAGALVGLNLGIAPVPASARRSFSYLEGNESINTDGVLREGTGTEDFFGSAWFFPKEPFNRANWGMTYKNELPPRVSAYRLMISDAVTWRKNLRFEFESGRHNNGDDLEYRWVSFWYQKPPLTYEMVDKLAGTDAVPEASSPGEPGVDPIPWIVIGLVVLAVVGWTLKRNSRNRAT